jgi:hypothetical protein
MVDHTHAPLYTDCLALAEWLLGHFQEDERVLPRELCTLGLALLDAVVLALKERESEAQIEQADTLLLRLRMRLRLTPALHLLEERQMLHGLERADAIGRQLGGWLRSLGPV